MRPREVAVKVFHLAWNEPAAQGVCAVALDPATKLPGDAGLHELALLLVVPHTTSIRNNRWELVIPKRFLKPGAFHLQQIQNVPVIRLERKLGMLSPDEFRILKTTLITLLKLDQ